MDADHKVSLLLIQNPVFMAQPLAQATHLRLLAGSGIKILADDFSLRVRFVYLFAIGRALGSFGDKLKRPLLVVGCSIYNGWRMEDVWLDK